jgi:3-oxoacyl-[acyl-carrier protein] reductase
VKYGPYCRVNAPNPGAVETEGLASSGFLGNKLRATVLASTPLGRLGQPKDIADAAVFLASDASYWIDGQIIFAAGGLTY